MIPLPRKLQEFGLGPVTIRAVAATITSLDAAMTQLFHAVDSLDHFVRHDQSRWPRCSSACRPLSLDKHKLDPHAGLNEHSSHTTPIPSKIRFQRRESVGS